MRLFLNGRGLVEDGGGRRHGWLRVGLRQRDWLGRHHKSHPALAACPINFTALACHAPADSSTVVELFFGLQIFILYICKYMGADRSCTAVYEGAEEPGLNKVKKGEPGIATGLIAPEHRKHTPCGSIP